MSTNNISAPDTAAVHTDRRHNEPVMPPTRRPASRWLRALSVMGPAFIVGAWQFGPGNLVSAVQAGSLYINRGQSTEATTYDNDGYVMGERTSLKRGDLIGLDEVSVTTGYLGDLNTPSVFSRTGRMLDQNYLQVLVMRTVGSRLAVSADYSRVAGRATWRQALALRGLGPLDAIRLELYQRAQHGPSSGIAVTADRRVAVARSGRLRRRSS